MKQAPDSYENLYPHPEQPTEPAAPPTPFSLASSEVDSTPRMQSAAQTVRTLPPKSAPKPKKPFSPIPLLLVAGVVFLFLGGIIFLTNTWDMLPDAVRAASLFSAGIVAFGANALAERVFKLPKTGLAFYILGCVFLPLAMAGVGAFELMGKWFSFGGDGCMLVWSLVFVCVAVPALFGEKHYNSTALAWLGLSGIGAAWGCFGVFLGETLNVKEVTAKTIFGSMLVLFSIGATVWAEWYLRTHEKKTPLSKVMIPFLYPLMLTYAILIILLAKDFAAGTAIFSVLMGVLFLNKRFVAGKLHCGIFGVLLCLIAVLMQAEAIPSVHVTGFELFLFVVGAVSVLLMATYWCKGKFPELAHTFSTTGMIFSLPMLSVGGIASMFAAKDAGIFTFLLYGALLISLIFFFLDHKCLVPRDRGLFCIYFAVLFVNACLCSEDKNILQTLLLTGTALLLLGEAFLTKRMWMLVLAIGSCAAVLIQSLPHAAVWLYWFCTAGMLCGVVYAHLMKRLLLEKCCAWVGIPFLLASLGMTLNLWLEDEAMIWSLLLAAETLLYLLEVVFLWHHLRTKGSVPYLETVALITTIIASIAFLAQDVSGGWGFLLLACMLVLSVGSVRKDTNFISIPYLLFIFLTGRHLILALEENNIIMDPTWLHLAQIGAFLLMLAVFAGMGRILLPEGFCTKGKLQLDFPLLMAIFPVFGVSHTIDWYPSILSSLFLSLYSLLYIGRVKNRSIPALLASFFGCTTLLLHNTNDPFGVLEWLRKLEIRTPQILLYLLPMHLFIFSLLYILPKGCRNGVHIARFCMYCFTMLCLLLSSFRFGHVTDALILMLFSFAILAGSFFVKRLRWFGLGFSVLVIMTLRLTKTFWTSLHWSIYLFLAGGVLIAIASAYELRTRKAAEHPNEPKKKFKPFSDWRF